MAEPDYQRSLRILCDTRRRSWSCESHQANLSTFIPIFQVFSPAAVIFSGIGVLLSVSSLFDPGVEAILTMKFLSGSQRCRMRPRCHYRSLRTYRKLLQASRVLYSSAANGRNDRHNRKDNGRSVEHLRDCDQGNEAEPSECVALTDT